MARRRNADGKSPSERLEALIQEALDVAKKARKHHQNLGRDNFYGNKLAALRADATNAFAELGSQSAGDASALAELIEAVFSPQKSQKDRANSAREILHALRTTWKSQPSQLLGAPAGDGVFPLTILVETKRSYLTTIGRQMNGCYEQGWFDACAVMMRRLLEISIIEAFEHQGIAGRIKGSDGNYLQLSDLIGRAIGESAFTLSRNAKTYLPQLRDIGHMSAHGRYFRAQKTDIDKVQQGCRVVVEEFLHLSGLL